jgi:hypothetical protein
MGAKVRSMFWSLLTTEEFRCAVIKAQRCFLLFFVFLDSYVQVVVLLLFLLLRLVVVVVARRAKLFLSLFIIL